MKQERPIDRSKPSNRRCINCIHYPERVPNPKFDKMQGCFSREKPDVCPTMRVAIDYWNSCAYFEWNPDKTYTD